MSYIKTWNERCDEHPDHQSGMVSNGMIQARMQEEIDDLRAENERLGASILSLAKSLRASLDAAIRQRDEARTEIERLKRDSDEA